MENTTNNAEETAQSEIGVDVEKPTDQTPVTTVTKNDAVTTNDENIIVANIHGKYKRFERLEHVPAGCRTYTSKAELKGQTKKQLETIYAYVMGVDPKTFPTHEMAVDNVWGAFSKLPTFDPVKDAPEQTEKDSKKSRNAAAKSEAGAEDDANRKKKTYQKKREDNVYIIKPVSEKSTKLIDELAPQAKACVEIIRLDGKSKYTEAELKSLMEANKEKFRTRQTAWRIFQYYRSNLISADVLVQN